MHITDLQSPQGLQEEAPNARMAESVDALVSNTSGAIRAGSIPAPGTRKWPTDTCRPFLYKIFPTFSPHLTIILQKVLEFFCFCTAHITPSNCCHFSDELEPAGEVVADRYSDCRGDFGDLYSRIMEDNLLGFFNTEGVKPYLKWHTKGSIEVIGEISVVDVDLLCKALDGDTWHTVSLGLYPLIQYERNLLNLFHT